MDTGYLGESTTNYNGILAYLASRSSLGGEYLSREMEARPDAWRDINYPRFPAPFAQILSRCVAASAHLYFTRRTRRIVYKCIQRRYFTRMKLLSCENTDWNEFFTALLCQVNSQVFYVTNALDSWSVSGVGTRKSTREGWKIFVPSVNTFVPWTILFLLSCCISYVKELPEENLKYGRDRILISPVL